MSSGRNNNAIENTKRNAPPAITYIPAFRLVVSPRKSMIAAMTIPPMARNIMILLPLSLKYLLTVSSVRYSDFADS